MCDGTDVGFSNSVCPEDACSMKTLVSLPLYGFHLQCLILAKLSIEHIIKMIKSVTV